MFKCNFKAYEGTEKYLFISYAHKDSDMVYPIIERLNEEGYRVWYDDGITPGSEWPENIAVHLEKCETFIFFASPNSVSSDNCKREVNFALSRNKEFFTISLVPTELTLGLELQISTQQNILMYEYDDMEKFYNTIFEASSLAPCKRSEGEVEVPKASISRTVESKPLNRDAQDVNAQSSAKKKGSKALIIIAAFVSLVFLGVIVVIIISKNSNKKIVLDSGQSIYADTTYLSVYEGSIITKNDISKMSKLKNVTTLQLSECTFEDGADLANLKFLPNICTLEVEDTEVQDYSFLQKMSSLESLEIVGSNFGGKLSTLPVKTIERIGLKNVGEVDINGLSGFSSLDTLLIYDSPLTEVTDPLPGSISELALSGCGLTNTDFLKNSKFSYFSYLDLSDNEIEDISFLSSYLDTVYSLDLSNTKISGESISLVQCCTNVYKLKLNNVPLQDLKVISVMDELSDLELSGCGLSSLENGNLSDKRFRRLVLSDNNLTSIEELSTIADEDSYGVDVLDISNNQITSLKSLPIVEYSIFASYGNNIDYTAAENKKFLEDASFKNFFANYFDGMENVNVYYMLIIVDGTADNQATLISNGCDIFCQPSAESYVKDKFVSTDYDVSIW